MESIEVKRFVSKEFQTAEALKTLRTNLMFSGEDIRVVGLTSFSAAEGKSSVSFQLAASLAQTGKQVLLLDADLRKSFMQSKLKVRGKFMGLSHYLSGMANVNETLVETDVPGLYIIFAGTRVPNASELLGSNRFKQLILALKESFDYVIVDTAPLGQVIDCAVMAPELDGTLIVVDVTHNSHRLVRQVQNQLKKSGGKLLGVVLNRVDFKDKSGYYGKAYGYGYGYGYGEEENKQK